MATYYDPEVGLLGGDSKSDYAFEFAERQVRQGFIRKVLGLLGLQLIITAGVTAAFVLHAPLRAYVFAAQWPFWTAFGVSLALVIALGCSETLRRSHPWNLLVLGAFTACEALLVGTVSAMHDTKIVLLAVACTAVVVLGCAVFAMQSRVDLTLSSGTLLSALLALMAVSLLNLIVRAAWLSALLAGLVVFIFSVYLVFDLQLLMGGRTVSLSPDEYVFAALNLYLDIINIFLYLLQLLGQANRD